MVKNLLAICTYNRLKDLENLFDSLLVIDLSDFCVLIVDATTKEDEKYWDWVKFKHEELKNVLSSPKIIWFQHKKGLTVQRNSALEYARVETFEFIHFIDDDVELDDEYFKYICDYFRNDDLCIGITGQRLGESPNIPPRNQNFFSSLYLKAQRRIDGLLTFGSVSKSGKNSMCYGDTILKVDWLSGCSMSYRLEGIEGKFFSREFSDYSLMEDLDFSYSLKGSGNLIYLPNAKLKHNVSSANRWDYLKGLRIEAHNRTSFVHRHRDTLSLSRHVLSYSLNIIRLFLQGAKNHDRIPEGFAVLRGLITGLYKGHYL